MADRQEIDRILGKLAVAPTRFAALLSSLEDADSVDNSNEGEWTPQRVFAHLRAANAILEMRIFFVLVRDNPPLVGYDDVKWLEVARFTSLPLTESLQSMRSSRNELVRALQALEPDDWGRAGTHEVRGPMTVLEIAQQIVEHEDDHLDQIERGVGRHNVC